MVGVAWYEGAGRPSILAASQDVHTHLDTRRVPDLPAYLPRFL